MCSWSYLVGAGIRGSSTMTCNCWMGPWVVWECISGWCELRSQQHTDQAGDDKQDMRCKKEGNTPIDGGVKTQW